MQTRCQRNNKNATCQMSLLVFAHYIRIADAGRAIRLNKNNDGVRIDIKFSYKTAVNT
jgi:hypothetical protein